MGNLCSSSKAEPNYSNAKTVPIDNNNNKNSGSTAKIVSNTNTNSTLRSTTQMKYIADNYTSLAEVHLGLRESGLESSELIIGIDCTKVRSTPNIKHTTHHTSHTTFSCLLILLWLLLCLFVCLFLV